MKPYFISGANTFKIMVWRGGREAEGNGLLNRRRGECLYRGFESRPLR
jgi:hypothetical protein